MKLSRLDTGTTFDFSTSGLGSGTMSTDSNAMRSSGEGSDADALTCCFTSTARGATWRA